MKFEYTFESLRARLLLLPTPATRIFICSCVERLFPAYVDYCRSIDSEDHVFLAGVVDGLWLELAEARVPTCEEEKQCRSMIPNADEVTWSDSAAIAEDLVSAVCYAVRFCRSGDITDATWAAYKNYDAADYLAQVSLDVSFSDPGFEEELSETSFVHDEVGRQVRDLDELGAADAQFDQLAHAFRERARSERLDKGWVDTSV